MNNFLNSQNMNDAAEFMVKESQKIILNELSDLIKSGVLSIEIGAPQFVQSCDSMKIEVRQPVKIVVKERERIKTLENEIQSLKSDNYKLQQELYDLQKQNNPKEKKHENNKP